jgi:antirestriction protein
MEAYLEIERFDDWSNLVESYEEDWDRDIIYYKNMSMSDVAYDYINECYDLEKMLGNLACYFDYEAFARDLSFDGFHETENGVIEIR